MADDAVARLSKMAAEAADPADREWAKAKLASMGGAPAAPAVNPGLTPERKAELEAKSAGYKRDIAALKAEPDPEYVTESIRGAHAGLSDMLNTASFGGYKKVRDSVLSKVSPETLSTVQRAEKDLSEGAGGGPLHLLAKAAGYATGPVGLLGRLGGMAARGLGGGIAANAVSGAATGGITSGAEDYIEHGDTVHALKAAGVGAVGGGIVGGGVGVAGRVLGGAPARAAESELGGLSEGVQYKTRLQKFLPKADAIKAELAQDPALRTAIKVDPVKALPQVEAKLSQIAENDLEPFYQRLVQTGKAHVPIGVATDNLRAVEAGFNKFAEKGQRAVVADLIQSLEDEAAKAGGKIPAQTLRETATAFQSQGNANLPNFGQIPLSKEMKQGVGNALRSAVADHVESIASDPAIGKAYRVAFEDANRRVSTWYAIKDILAEKADRIRGNAPATGDLVKHLMHGVNHPIMSALPFVPPAADAFNRRILAPTVSSQLGQSMAPALGAAGETAKLSGSALARRILYPNEEGNQ